MKWGITSAVLMTPIIALGAEYSIGCTEKFCVAIRDEGQTFYGELLDKDMGFFWFKTNNLANASMFIPVARISAFCEVLKRRQEKLIESGDMRLEANLLKLN
jgi:hypothetical protein